MPDDQRVYSDEEFAIILRKATELAGREESSPAAAATGLTLPEMKAAAAQAGFDPALIERAARLLAARAAASPFERLLGGPLRHDQEARFSIRLDESRAARLLSAVQISAGHAGGFNPGHSSPMGVTWHDGGETETLRVTARAEEHGTSVSVALDRRGTLVQTAVFSGFGVFLSWFAGLMLSGVDPALGVGAGLAGTGGVLAAARGYWAASTRKVQERIGAVMDAIGQTLGRTEGGPSSSEGGPARG